MMAAVTVVIPTCDRPAQLERALASVAAQTLRSFETVVVDDGEEPVGAPAGVTLIRTTGREGAAAARNRAIVGIQTEYVAFLDDDDVWRPGFLAAQLASLGAAAEAALAVAGHLERDARGRLRVPDTSPVLPGADPLRSLLAGCPIHSLSLVVARRSAFDRFGLFDETLEIAHDLDWYARVLCGSGGIVRVPEVLVERTVPGGLVRDLRRWRAEEQIVLGRYPSAADARVRVARSLFFASSAMRSAELGLAARCVASALASPRDALDVVGEALRRRRLAAASDASEVPA